MNDHKFKLLALAVVGVIGISIALVAPNPSIAAPPGNPPSANVSPNFTNANISGDLSVSGTAEVDTLDVINQVSSDIDIRGNIINERQTSSPGPPCTWEWTGGTFGFYVLVCTGPPVVTEYPISISDDTFINGDVDINGNLKANSIGKVTVRPAYGTVTAGLGGNAVSSCNSGEIRLSCGGGFNGGLDMDLNYVQPLNGTTNQCITFVTNHTSSSQTVTSFATCLDPDGS